MKKSITPNKKLKLGIAIIFLAILAYAVNFAIKYAYIGSAYDAKMVCSCTFVSHRNFEGIKIEDLYAVPFATINIDKKEQSVTANIYGLAETIAIFRLGLGCTLVNEMEETEIRRLLTPIGNVLATEIENSEIITSKTKNSGSTFGGWGAINEAFTEINPKNIKRTRAIVVLKNGKIIAEKIASNIKSTIYK